MAVTDAITPEAKLSIVRQKVQMWRNSAFSAQLDAEVAKATSDDDMLKRAQEDYKRALHGVRLMEELIKRLESTSEEEPNDAGKTA